MFSSNFTGNLVVKPLTAKLKKDKDLFTKMDPYVKVILGSQTHRTHTSWNSGKHPGWKDSMNFKRLSEDILTFEVWDKDILSRDDMVGTGTLSVNSIIQSNNRLNEWVPLYYKGKSAGELLVDISFIPDVQTQNVNMGMQYGYQQPIYQQPMMQNQPIYPQQQNLQMPNQQPLYKQNPNQFIPPQQQNLNPNQPNQGQFQGQPFNPNYQGSNYYNPNY